MRARKEPEWSPQCPHQVTAKRTLLGFFNLSSFHPQFQAGWKASVTEFPIEDQACESTTASCFVCTKKSLHTFIFLSLLSYGLKHPLGKVYEPVGGCSWIMCTPISPDLCLSFCFLGKALLKFLFSSCTKFTSCFSDVHRYDAF